jgi:riboflavin synthase
MFTGIVEALGRVARLEARGAGRRLVVQLPAGADWRVAAGESVAVNGVCLTVVEAETRRLGFDLAEETWRVTALADLAGGDAVNLERPLRLDARLGGHLVLGHVDGVGRVCGSRPEGEGRRLTVSVSDHLRPLLIPKGSVAVDGVSLTVAELREAEFDVALIPHTLAMTTLGLREIGARVNLETDVIGKYVRSFVERLSPAGDPAGAPRGGAGGRRG